MCVRGGGSAALACNKKQECLGKDKRLQFEQQLLHHVHSLTSFLLPPQLDYTDAGTCDKCFEKRKNVSLAAESCTCTIKFDVNKRLKVKLPQCSEELVILCKTQTSPVTDAVVPGRRLLLLRPQKLPPESPQIHGLQGRHTDGRQKEKLKGITHRIYFYVTASTILSCKASLWNKQLRIRSTDSGSQKRIEQKQMEKNLQV